MDERKIIQSGPGSYVVTLPIAWIKKNKFSKGSTIYVKEDSTNTIVVYPKFKEITPEQREIIIDTSTYGLDEINNNIISSYLNNSKKIVLKNIKEDYRKQIKELINILPGLQIAEQSKNSILIEDILNIESVNILQTSKRIDMMIRNMLNNFLNTDYLLIYEIDQNIFGQSLFIKRILKYALRDPAIMNTISLNAEKIMEYVIITEQLENISNKIKNISQENITQKQQQEYSEIFKILQEQYLNAINSFYHFDRNLATKVFKTKKVIYNTLKAIKNQNHTINTECILFDKSCRIIGRITFDKWGGEEIINKNS